MNYTDARDSIKSKLPEYVAGITQKSKGQSGNYNCPICKSGTHKNHSGAFSIYDNGMKWKCHSCGKGGDIFDLIGEVENIPEPKEQLKRGAELFGITLDRPAAAAAPGATSKPAPVKKEDAATKPETAADYMPFFYECIEHRGESDYLQKRFIGEELQKRFMIGFCKEWVTPSAKDKGIKPTPRVIIPTSRSSYLARATDPDTAPQYSKMKVGAVVPFNHKCLFKAETPIYIVEGEIDALSIIQAGAESIGLGSISMVDKFLTAYIGDKQPAQPLIVSLDNDGKEQTKQAAEKLKQGLAERNIIFVEYSPCGEYKDANEALCNAPADFEQAVKDGVEKAKEAERIAKEAELKLYQAHFNAAQLLPDFLQNVRRGKTANILPTGFPGVDAALDGGLDMGLCFIGAISSLGKTTFCLQLAEQIAAAGHDILFFSLEMPKEELISKSLSRITLQSCLKDGADTREASTSRAILRRFRELRTAEKDRIEAAAEVYTKTTERLYIQEGIGDIGADQVREAVEAHKRITGNTPIIFVDYAQILSPHNERATDKQNTDKAVLELKKISRDFKTTVIAISSFNRENYAAPVSMASFKESGAIEYSSDILIGLQYDGMEYVEGESEKDRNHRIRQLLAEQIEKGRSGDAQTIQVKILKNRNGSRGSATLQFYPMFNAFVDNTAANNPFEQM